MNAKFTITRCARRFAPALLATALFGTVNASFAAPGDDLLGANIALDAGVGGSSQRQVMADGDVVQSPLGEQPVVTQVLPAGGTPSPAFERAGNAALLNPVNGLNGVTSPLAPIAAPVTGLIRNIASPIGGGNLVGGGKASGGLLAPVTGLVAGVTGGGNRAGGVNAPAGLLAPVTGLVGGLTGGGNLAAGARAAGGPLAPVAELPGQVLASVGELVQKVEPLQKLGLGGIVNNTVSGLTGVVDGLTDTVANLGSTAERPSKTAAQPGGLLGGLLGGLASAPAGRRQP